MTHMLLTKIADSPKHVATIFLCERAILMRPNVRGHRADEMKDATASAASEADLHPI
jgi:hypothetical protein